MRSPCLVPESPGKECAGRKDYPRPAQTRSGPCCDSWLPSDRIARDIVRRWRDAGRHRRSTRKWMGRRTRAGWARLTSWNRMWIESRKTRPESPSENRRLGRRRFARWPGPSGARMQRYPDVAPRVARERQMEWLGAEFSRAQRRAKKKKQVARPGAQSHVRIVLAECPDWCLGRARFPSEFRLALRLRRSRYPFHTEPWSVSKTLHRPLRSNPAVV